MRKSIMKRGLSGLLAVLMMFTTFIGLGTTTVFAAAETAESYMVSYPRDGDAVQVYDQSVWGHSAKTYMNGWSTTGSTTTTIHCMDSFDGKVCYCIEPGITRNVGDIYTMYDENFWDNYPSSLNSTIEPDDIKLLLGRIMQYGYQGNISTSWKSQNSDDADKMAHALATQILVWETVIGERDSAFNHVSPGSYDAVKSVVSANHPLYSRVCSYYDSIVASVQSHTKLPSFMAKSSAKAQNIELEWNGSEYTATLTDTNDVVSKYSFKSDVSGISFSVSGNKLTITATEAPTDAVTITASKSNARSGVIVWSDGQHRSGGVQDTVTYSATVSDPVKAYLNIKVSYGEAKIVKHSEDGKIAGVKFNISGNGIDQTVSTESDGTISIPNLAPGDYVVSEVTEDRYEPQTPQTITVLSGRTATVTFSNTLKRGDLEVTKSSEDGLIKGVKFHLFGTSLSGLVVDEYAVTDAYGVAYFDDVLISGTTPYTLEEVDTAIRYVVPDDQTAPILWNDVTGRSFTNILKKFRVEVVKSDAETGTAQGDASLAGAKYGLYKGSALQATYTTDVNGSFISDYFVCDTDWTLREISPSEGYLINKTVYTIPADAENFKVELNPISMDVDEQVIKGNIRLVKHIDMPNPDVETVEASNDESLNHDIVPMLALTSPDTEIEAASEETSKEVAELNEDTETQEVVEDVPSEEADESIPEVEPEKASETEPEEENATETDLQYDEPPEVPMDEIEASGGEGVIEKPESNAKFVIFLASAGSFDAAKDSERDTLVTDEDGFAYSKDLPYGRYRVHQVEGMDGQAFIPDFTVFVSKNGKTYSYILNNQTTSSFIRIEKRDAETKKIIPAANIGFQVKDLSTGEIITQTVYYPTPVTITTFYTNDEGWLMLPYELNYGQYELIEVQTCYGYILDANPVSFTVDGSSDVVTVEKYNYAQKGIIKVQKTGEVFNSVLETEGMYQPVYEVTGLEGAEFTITAAEDVTTLDGTVRYEKGEIVSVITTGETGWAQSEPLYLGKYEISETGVPAPMVLSDEKLSVELTYAGQEVELTEISAGMYNDRQKVEITILKSLEQDTVFGFGMNGELAGVSFGLYASEEMTAKDGSVIPADGLMEVVSFSEDGSAKCKTDLPIGTYYLQERTTNSQYILDDTKYPVLFTYTGPENAVVRLVANGGEAIQNELIYGTIAGKKLDDKGAGLGGATIGLFASDEGEFTEKNAILTTVSADDGSFAFENVPRGTWYLREIEQPTGYVLCVDVFPVNIDADGQIVEISITNKLIRGNLSLTKVDADYPDHKLSGAEFEVYRDANGDKKLDKNDELIGVMPETSIGIYEMKDLEFGGLLIREKKAPDGFYLDEGIYYVSIEKDGETYVIENEAGHGFINQAHRGNLKIVKTSSDGNVKGFSFRITGENYDKVFTTDSSGMIYIEGLRVQKYIVTELEDSVSKDYKRPEPVTVELVTDETLTVNVHNEKVTVDVPKTGDETNMVLWTSLMGIGLLGVGAVILGYSKKKRSAIQNDKESR